MRPTRQEIDHADQIYHAWRDGRAKTYTLVRGQIRRRGILAALAAVQWRPAHVQTLLLTGLAAGVVTGGLAYQWQLSPQVGPLLAGGLAVAGILSLGISVQRRVSRTLANSQHFVLQVAAGNLTVQEPAHGSDDMGQLIEALVTMKKGLGGIVGDVNAGIDRVRPAVEGIHQSNENISLHTDALASSVQETAASTEELMMTVQQNADNAQQASRLALSNVQEVENAGAGMAQVVQRMAAITESARHMAEVVSVIDGIAFQSNILSLNASVEAARAGEQGKGFAVVAGEVRSLASRSSEAAREIHQLIHACNAEVDAGARVVQDTEVAIKRVIAASSRVNDLMEEISSASQEQSSGISQISEAVNQMEQGVQQNAQKTQATYAATQALQEEAYHLLHAIRAFRTQASGQELAAEIDVQVSLSEARLAD